MAVVLATAKWQWITNLGLSFNHSLHNKDLKVERKSSWLAASQTGLRVSPRFLGRFNARWQIICIEKAKFIKDVFKNRWFHSFPHALQCANNLTVYGDKAKNKNPSAQFGAAVIHFSTLGSGANHSDNSDIYCATRVTILCVYKYYNSNKGVQETGKNKPSKFWIWKSQARNPRLGHFRWLSSASL